MKKNIIIAIAVLMAATFPAKAAAPKDSTATPSYWTKGLITQIGFSQLSLTNWAAGGSGNISLNTYLDGYTNYKKENVIWNNEIQLGYGFIQQFDGTKAKKSDDRIILDSKFGYKAADNLYMSAVFNFRSQFANGYDYANDNKYVSAFFAPAYMSLGLGIDWQPAKFVAINFAPLTGKTVMVADTLLRESYGNAIDQFCRFELGAQMKADFKYEIKNFIVGSNLTLFADYLDIKSGVKVNWDVNIDAKISKLFSVTLRTSLIYDKKIKCKKQYDASGENYTMVPGVQFKEIFSVGFSYTIGQSK